ncbi:MAG: tRNA1(Val) (adenine(37)-N6)-methyltransferase [Desulfovibrio sp.]
MTEEARKAFPNGMKQPEDGYRFSVDPLLLSDFFRPVKKGRGVDLGTGCGIIPCALQLEYPKSAMRIHGLDIRPVAIECSKENSARLGLDDSLTFSLADLKERSQLPSHQSCDFVTANPPYRTGKEGRSCPQKDRQTARFEEEGSLKDFIQAAAYLLKTRARFTMVHLPERMGDIIEELRSVNLEPKRIQFVHSRIDDPAKIMLVEAVKAGAAGLIIEPPLVLYSGKGNDTTSMNRWCR